MNPDEYVLDLARARDGGVNPVRDVGAGPSCPDFFADDPGGAGKDNSKIGCQGFAGGVFDAGPLWHSLSYDPI